MAKRWITALCACMWIPWVLAQSPSEPPEVFAHSSVGVQQLTSAQLRSIFMMRQVKWPNGTPIRVYVLPPKSTTHLLFVEQKLQLFPYQLERVWQKLTYSGTGAPPIEVPDLASMVELVQSTPGAIGYGEIKEKPSALQIIQIKP